MQRLKTFLLLLFSCSLLSSVNKFSSERQLFQFIKKERNSFEGWCSEEKALAIARHIVSEKPEVCVEIGVFGGASIFPAALALQFNKIGKVYAIDPWSNAECMKYHLKGDPNREYWSKVNLEAAFQKFTQQIKKFDLSRQCKVLRMTSKKALARVPNSIDFLHIDGNRQEEASHFDTTQYFRKVKLNGYILFEGIGWYSNASKTWTTRRSLDFLIQHCNVIRVTDRGAGVLLQKVKETHDS